jgi:wyosine [tRNA(Phe)-imidazoG37] synthetase (radical SAM superfamily)
MTALHLERCLLVDNVPRHVCTYACSHCGYDPAPTSRRSAGYEVDAAVRRIEDGLRRLEGTVDHLAIAADGEPTLDRQLGALLLALRHLGLPRVVYTNGGTLHRDDVRQELEEADVVCLALDTVDPAAWQAIHQPPSPQTYELVQQGVRVFPSTYRGEIVTQTTLRAELNSDLAQVEETADFLGSLKPTCCYLRQHADETPSDARMERARQVFAERVRRVVVGDPYGAVLGTVKLAGALRAGRPGRDLAAPASAN